MGNDKQQPKDASNGMTAGPLVLAILDGWGVAPAGTGNPVSLAKTPVLDSWDDRYRHTTLLASGVDVGLMPDQDGNSEAGHMNIGAGRVVLQDNVRISQSINDGTFFRNPAFVAALHHVQHRHSRLHLMGMLGSHQSAHADPDHLLALLMFAQNHKLQEIYLHLFTDGRDSPRYYAREIISRFLPHLGDAKIGSIMGRFYAMDRNKAWSRTRKAYMAIVEGHGDHRVDNPLDAVSQAYNRGESDEFISPTIIKPYDGIRDGDAIIFFNLRSDRARQLTKTFVQSSFEEKNAATKPFDRPRLLHDVSFVAMTDFGPDLDSILTAYPAETLTQTLPMTLGDLRQLYIAESEKYAHVTYFFNGGYADAIAKEQRVMVPSPSVKFYDKTPAMSSHQITKRVVAAVQQGAQDVIVVNFAATDMVAHTGNIAAAVSAMEAIDACLGQLAEAVLAAHGSLLVTGDHGNIEEMLNVTTGEVDTEHSNNPVPFYVITADKGSRKLRADGRISDIAPTMLDILHRPKPEAMTGRSLFVS